MRDLHEFELNHVSGAGCSPCAPCPPSKGKGKGKGKKNKMKGNNGFGNGGNDGVPGNSDFEDENR